MVTEIIVPPPKRIQEDVEHLKEWISKEPHLPKIEDEKWLRTFLYHNKFSLEKTKSKLENYYSLRSKYPELLKNRDPTAPEILKSRQWITVAISDKLKSKNIWILYYKYEPDAGSFDVITQQRRMYMIMDLLLLKEENRLTQLISIVDFRDFKYLHALKYMAEVSKISEVSTKAYSERTKAMHFVNFPNFAQKFFELSRKFYPDKFNERTHIHTNSGMNVLLEMVGEEALSRDYGGSGPSLEEMEEWTQQELEKHRKWFAEQDDVCSDESLRRKDFDQVEEMKGSFRKLEVD